MLIEIKFTETSKLNENFLFLLCPVECKAQSRWCNLMYVVVGQIELVLYSVLTCVL